MLGFNEYFWSVLLNQYVDFKGVASRKQYWLYVLWRYVIIFLTLIVMLILLISLKAEAELAFLFCLVVFLTLILITAIPSIAITVRRLHDINMSGWFYLLRFVPYGGIVVFIFMLLPTEKVDNIYTKEGKQISEEVQELRSEVNRLKEKVEIDNLKKEVEALKKTINKKTK